MISIVIPTYNVENYLHRCIDSVLAQSYQDFEVILVDDGSIDSTPEICDYLALKDFRIRVIHKKNGGLSSARNVGIEAANGDWLMFVDSDDWLHPECVKLLLSDVLTYDVKMAMAGHMRTSQPINQEAAQKDDFLVVVDRDKAIPRMLHGEWISAWSKLYHRSLWENVRFPEGLNNEDYAILIRIFEQCEKVTYRKEPLYYYYIHEGSICRSKMNPHTFDEFRTGQMVWEYCKQKFPQWSNIALFNLTASIIKLTGQCITTGQFMEKYDEMKAYFNANKALMLSNPELSTKYKPFLWTMSMGKVAHRIFVTLYNKYAS